MIMYHDTLDQVPDIQITTCDFHKQNPGKQFAGCCCSSSFGWRKATTEEEQANIAKRLKELETKIKELSAERSRLQRLLLEGD